MERKFVKKCFVPDCNSNTKDNPKKIFIRLPKSTELRKKWALAVGRTWKSFRDNSEVFCCQDHFNVTEELEDRTDVKLKGVRMRLKENVLPRKRKLSSKSLGPLLKKATIDVTNSNHIPKAITSQDEIEMEQTKPKGFEIRKKLVETLVREEKQTILNERSGLFCYTDHLDERETQHSQELNSQIENSDPVLINVEPDIPEYIELESDTEEENSSSETKSEFEDEDIQILEDVQKFSKERETQDSQEAEINENELVVLQDDVPEHREVRSFLLKQLKKTIHRQSTGTSIEMTHLSEEINQSLYEERSLEVLKLLEETQRRSRTRIRDEQLLTANCNLDLTKKLIHSFPFRYTGLSPAVLQIFTENIIHGAKVNFHHVLLVLVKIRENQSFERLGNDFGISGEEAKQIFLYSVPLIANYLQNNFAWPAINAKSENPFFFDSHFENIKFIVDCLEIEVEAPKNAITAKVLKNAEKCYSVKYLISYTRLGLINCMSSGYGGSRSDKFVLETSGYLSRLHFPKKALILTDESYFQSEELFSDKNCKLIRLKEEVERLEEFICLKKLLEYVETVMKRLREFRYISRHAFLNEDLTSVLDYVVIIASAIVNTQGTVI